MLSNAYPIQIKNREFMLQALNYDKELLQTLRQKHNKTHSFFRQDGKIYCLWNEGEKISHGEDIVVSTTESPEIVDSLIHHLFFRTLIRELPDRKPLSFYPLRVISQKKGHDAIKNLLPTELQDVVCFNLLVEFQSRRIMTGTETVPHLLINIRRRWQVNRNLAELVEENYPLIGVPIIHSEPVDGLSNILAPIETAIGLVKSIHAGYATVDTNEGELQLPLNELYLRKSRKEIDGYLTFKLGRRKTHRILNRVYAIDSLTSNAEQLHNEMQTMINLISKWSFTSKSEFSFNLENSSILQGQKLQFQSVPFLFDVTPGSATTTPLSGLSRFGPYDSAFFRPKEIKILVVCQSKNRGGFSKTMAALDNGISESKYFKKGFRELYRLHKIKWDIKETTGLLPKDFITTINNAISNCGDNIYDLAIIEGIDEQRNLPTKQNAFYMAKALLLGIGIPVQGLRQAHIRKQGDYLANILGPMALQIYAKLGGTPWTLSGSHDVDREIIVGIGSAEKIDSEFKGGNFRRIVGLTTFFSNDGRFLMANTCKAVPYEDYFNELLRGLENSIENLSRSTEQPWEDGDTVRIIFHIFKPIKNIEADVVEKLVNKFHKYNIQYAFVTISTKHPFILFDNRQQNNQQAKGYFIPYRGENIQLSELECLIQLRGKNEVKTRSHGLSRPALIRIHERSTFKDLTHIVGQIMNFTHLSWKTFFATHSPVSISYADDIAKWLDRLEGLPGWNPAIVNTSLKRKKWFL